MKTNNLNILIEFQDIDRYGKKHNQIEIGSSCSYEDCLILLLSLSKEFIKSCLKSKKFLKK